MNNDFLYNPLLGTNKMFEFSNAKDYSFRNKYYKIVDDFLKYKHDENDLVYLEKAIKETRANIVADLIQKHYDGLSTDIKALFGLKDVSLLDIEKIFGITPIVTKRRKSSICHSIVHIVGGEIEEKYNELCDESNNQLDKLIDYTKRLNRSIELCENEAEIKELLAQQGFIKNGLILAPGEVEVKI